MDDRYVSDLPDKPSILQIPISRQAVLAGDLSPAIEPYRQLLQETRQRGAFTRLLNFKLTGFEAAENGAAGLPEIQAWFYELHRQHPALPFWLDVPSTRLYLEAARPKARFSPKAQMLHAAGSRLLDRGLMVVMMEVLSAGQLLCYEMFPRHSTVVEGLIATARGRLDAALTALAAFNPDQFASAL